MKHAALLLALTLCGAPPAAAEVVEESVGVTYAAAGAYPGGLDKLAAPSIPSSAISCDG